MNIISRQLLGAWCGEMWFEVVDHHASHICSSEGWRSWHSCNFIPVDNKIVIAAPSGAQQSILTKFNISTLNVNSNAATSAGQLIALVYAIALDFILQIMAMIYVLFKAIKVTQPSLTI